MHENTVNKYTNDGYTNEEYIITANVNKPLAKILDIQELQSNNTDYDNWTPPQESGLNNSNVIIPNYYNNKNSNLLSVDYFEMIKDDIRNYRKLNSYQLDFIQKIDHDNKNEIIRILNQCMNNIIDISGINEP